MRTFIAIEIPEGIRKKVDGLIKSFSEKNLPIKWVKFENLHITLKFLGEIKEEKLSDIHTVLKNIAEKHPAFELNLESLGCFPNKKNPRVLWIGVNQGKKLINQLVLNLEQELLPLGFKKEKRFHPHLTIGRIKRFCQIDDILAQKFVCGLFWVDSLTLFKSTLRPEGPIYEKIIKLPLIRK